MVMLSGCDQSDSSGPQDVSNKMPPIHVDQTVELLFDGNNSVREIYTNTIRDCLAAGLQSRALSEEDIALVGVTRYEAWFAQDMIVLEQMPLNGQGYKVFTTNITIGRVFEPSQLKNPASEDRN